MSAQSKPNFSSTNMLLDATAFPVLYVRISGVPDKSDYAALAAGLEEYLAMDVKTITIGDLRGATKLKLFAASGFWVPWAAKHKSQIDALSSGAVFIAQSKIVAKVVGGVMKLLPVGIPMMMFTSLDEALDWVADKGAYLALPDRAALAAVIEQ